MNSRSPAPGRNPFLYEATLWLIQPREEVFQFFSDVVNLQRITPKWLHFRILTPPPILMQEGTLIDYRLRVHGIPIRWRTCISLWDPPRCFVDDQVKGPYTLWHHTHTFDEQDGGTLMRDQVQYIPLGGSLINRLFVKRDVERIFGYRKSRILQLLAS